MYRRVCILWRENMWRLALLHCAPFSLSVRENVHDSLHSVCAWMRLSFLVSLLCYLPMLFFSSTRLVTSWWVCAIQSSRNKNHGLRFSSSKPLVIDGWSLLKRSWFHSRVLPWWVNHKNTKVLQTVTQIASCRAFFRWCFWEKQSLDFIEVRRCWTQNTRAPKIAFSIWLYSLFRL